MNIGEIIALLKTPERLTAGTKRELEGILDEYPWFLPARVLYVLNLRVLGDLNFRLELYSLALLAPDRAHLMACLAPESPVNFADGKKITAKQDAFDLIESFISAYPLSGMAEMELPARSDYLLTQQAEKQFYSAEAKEPDIPSKPEDRLIDDFLTKENQRVLPSAPAPGNAVAEEPFFLEDITDDDTYFTETLAQIYIRQKKYEKALEIIKQISLKYPKKNSYFADQIRFLEKLIINIKRDI